MEEIKANGTFDMSGLKLALTGLIFTAINIRIQGFDIFPDVIGYIMVIIGLGRIEKYSGCFSSAKIAAYLLTVLSLFNIYQAPVQNTAAAADMFTTTNSVNYNAGIFGSIPWLAALFMVAGTVANLYFACFMCRGMKNLLLRVGDDTLAGICDDRWKLILVAQIGVLASMLIAMIGIPFGTILAILFIILALIALILFLLLIHHTWKSVEGKDIINI